MTLALGRVMRTHQALVEHGVWIEPDTGDMYPIAYGAYRNKRETQDKRPPRHRPLAPDVDHIVWRRSVAASEFDVIFTLRPGISPRVQRMVSQVLAGIRRGHSATDSIRRVARRFGLPHRRARDFITAGITYERRPRAEVAGDAPWWLDARRTPAW